MPEFDLKHLLTSLCRFEYVYNFKDILGDEERFIAATLEIPFNIIEGTFSINDGHTKSYQKWRITWSRDTVRCKTAIWILTIPEPSIQTHFSLKKGLKQPSDADRINSQNISYILNFYFGLEISWSVGYVHH